MGKGSGKTLLIVLCPLPGIMANHSDCSITSHNLITEQCMAYERRDIVAAAEASAVRLDFDRLRDNQRETASSLS